MKRKFLIWSAVLTVVFGAALLQSCSADDDTFATEEYGYYTEEEIEFINNLARELNIAVVANPEYNGVKSNITEIEAELRGLAALLGKHEIKLSPTDSIKISTTRGTSDIARFKSRSSENIPTEGSWYCIGQNSVDNYVIDVDIQWNLQAVLPSQRVSGSVLVHYYNGYTTTYGIASGSLNCSLGGSSILFGGQISSGSSSKYIFSFEIVHGYLDLRTCTGNFDVISYK